MKKAITFTIATIFMLGLVMAVGNQLIASNKFSTQEIENFANKFQNRYQFNCTGDCFYMDGGLNQDFTNNLRLEVREQKRFLFFSVESRDVYYFNEDGEINVKTHNLWSRLLNKNRIRL